MLFIYTSFTWWRSEDRNIENKEYKYKWWTHLSTEMPSVQELCSDISHTVVYKYCNVNLMLVYYYLAIISTFSAFYWLSDTVSQSKPSSLLVSLFFQRPSHEASEGKDVDPPCRHFHQRLPVCACQSRVRKHVDSSRTHIDKDFSFWMI